MLVFPSRMKEREREKEKGGKKSSSVLQKSEKAEQRAPKPQICEGTQLITHEYEPSAILNVQEEFLLRTLCTYTEVRVN